jgi:ADP-heptose:LPS heptosyltransferase
VVDLSPKMETFLDCAHFINHLDLVITVDTSVAHLAGAIGKKTWLLIAHANDWRWGNEAEHTFWYPSMRIFRQLEKGNWDSVFENVNSEIKKFHPVRSGLNQQEL